MYSTLETTAHLSLDVIPFFEYHEPKSKINQLLLDLPENYLTASSI